MVFRLSTPLRTPRYRWENNIKMHIQEVGWGARAGLIWLRIWTVGGHLHIGKCVNVPSVSIKCGGISWIAENLLAFEQVNK